MSKEESELTAYCGLYCGDCFNYKGEIANLARDLRKKLREERFDRVSQGLTKYFKPFKDYEQCYQVLGAMVRLRCNRACQVYPISRPILSSPIYRNEAFRIVGTKVVRRGLDSMPALH